MLSSGAIWFTQSFRVAHESLGLHVILPAIPLWGIRSKPGVVVHFLPSVDPCQYAFPIQGAESWRQEGIDAFLPVYSVIDRPSFQKAIDLLYSIRKTEGSDMAVILVANKTDLMRARVVAEQGRNNSGLDTLHKIVCRTTLCQCQTTLSNINVSCFHNGASQTITIVMASSLGILKFRNSIILNVLLHRLSVICSMSVWGNRL